MQLPIAGQAYEHPSRDINYQRCVNLFPSFVGPGGNTDFALLPTAGKKELVNLGGVEGRAILNIDDTIYVVVDDTLYKLTINDNTETATGASVGTFDSVTGYMRYARNPTQAIFTNGTTSGHVLTISSDTLTKISDVDFTGGEHVVFMDSYFIYNSPDSTTMYATAINDGTSVSALDVATAEGNPDKLVGLAVDKRELWAFGQKSVEIWYDAANATGFPFSRREGAWIDQGCSARNSILNFDNTLMWLDDRGYVVKSVGYQVQVISTPAINNAINSYSRIDDAYAVQFVDQGHLIYMITFPTAKKSWAYDAVTQQWHERAYWNNDDTFVQDLMVDVVRYKQWYLGVAHNSGKVYIIDQETYTDAGDTIRRLRTTQHNNVELKQIGIDALEVHFESGKGLVTGQGNDPEIMMRYSHDGGYTWSNELWRKLGKIGEYDKRVRWNRLGSGREWIFEFSLSDPVDFAIVDANIDISGGLV